MTFLLSLCLSVHFLTLCQGEVWDVFRVVGALREWKKLSLPQAGLVRPPVGQERLALTQEIKHKILDRQHSVWAECKSAKRDKNPKMYLLEVYPGPTIPPVRPCRWRFWIWQRQYVVYLILFFPKCKSGLQRGTEGGNKPSANCAKCEMAALPIFEQLAHN